MSLTEKLRLRLPAYLIFSFLGLLGLLSLWLPKFAGTPDSAEAALTYSATSTIFRAPNDSRSRMISVGGVYYLAFTSTTGATPTSTCGPSGSCNLYFTTSSNGTSWSAPVLINTGLASDDGDNVASPLGGLTYNSYRGYFVITYKLQADRDIYIATSTNGVTWRGGAVVNGIPGSTTDTSGRVFNASATSTDLMAMVFRKENYIYVATSSNPAGTLSSWSSSTVDGIGFTYTGNGYNAEAIGISIEGTNTINVVFAVATTTEFRVTSARSTNRGATWTTSTISGPLTPGSTDLLGASVRSVSTAQIVNGRLAVLYRDVTSADMSGFPTSVSLTSRMVYAIQDSSGVWATSSFSASSMVINLTDTVNFMTEYPALTMFNGTQPAGIFYATSSYLALSVNTSTLVTETVTTDQVMQQAGMSVALNTTTRQLGMVYVSGNQLRFVTTSLRDTSWNVAPTTTAFTANFSTTGTGHVVLSTDVSDFEGDTAALDVYYSLNGGSTFTSTTIASAVASSGSLTTSSGRISGISTASTNTITMVWDTKADGVTSTTDVILIIIPTDAYTSGLSRAQTGTLNIDNVAAATPAFSSFTVATSSVNLTWGSVSGASTYTVSSTAGSAVSTSNVTTTFVSLSPNTLYTHQVRSVDAYGNTSTFSAATSTYTDPVTPGDASASAAGTTSMTVSWSANSNGSGTVYEVYNVTAGALSATTTATSYTVTGLTANTSYQFKVRAQYLANSASTTAYSATSTAASTSAEASSGSSSSSGGSAAAAAAAPAVPAAAPAVPATSRTETFEVGQPKPVSVGGASHTVTVKNVSATQVTAEIRSNPVIVTLKKGESSLVDTDADQINDIRVEYRGLINGKPEFTFTNLTDINERNNAVTINAGAYETSQAKVRLDFKVPTAVQMAISADPSFSTASFQAYQPSVTWNLSGSKGQKTVYVRFRTAAGGIATAQDSITLVVDGEPENKPTTNETIPTVTAATTYEFKQNLFAGSRGAAVTELQKILKSGGYLQAEATGFYGTQTVAAVKAFQKANGVQQTGGVGPATRAILNKGVVSPVVSMATPATASNAGSGYKFTQNLYIGARGASVTELQNRLKALGYMEDSATGFYGNATMAAVKKYQTANGIQPTGGVGPATRASLNK